jgi:2-C-methyl-D-erythritol 4-phosphate cytidylyltransferase
MNAAVIVAAGQGLRMRGPTRKQFMELEGLPIITHTLRVFDNHPDIHHIYLVIPTDAFTFCRESVLAQASLNTPLTLVAGGPARQDSVRNGLAAIGHLDGVVAIHDGVRPFVTSQHLTTCIREALDSGACILGIPATDTLKSVSSDGAIIGTLDRANIWLAQTPQVFRYELILKAHRIAEEAGIIGTDDAVLLEETLGVQIHITRGSRNNIKITTSEDLVLARALLQYL